MNIIDAIKSGRRFRRKDDTSWYSSMSDNYPIINISAISRENFFADDWEVEAQEVTITREQFDEAWDNSLRDEPRNNWELHAFLIRHLGL
jgi:hypothetical protein